MEGSGQLEEGDIGGDKPGGVVHDSSKEDEEFSLPTRMGPDDGDGDDEVPGGDQGSPTSLDATARLTRMSLETQPLERRDKHIFVLSSAGKPIFSRHGDEQQLAPLMGVIQAIISFSQEEAVSGAASANGGGDFIRCITTGRKRFVFLVRGDIFLLAVSSTGELEAYLKLQLEYLYQQIIFLLTLKRIQMKFKTNASYDLRELLGATHNILAGVVDMTSPHRDLNGCILTSSVQTLPLEPSMRNDLSRLLASTCQGLSDLLYGLLLCGTRIITLVQPRDPRLHLRSTDLLLLINFVTTQPSLKANESYTPFCLPRFNDAGYLHAYVSYLDPQSDICLLLISATGRGDQFHRCAMVRSEIDKAMQGDKDYLKAIRDSAFEHRLKAVGRYSNGAMAFHFLYKYCPTGNASVGLLSQCISSSFFFPYIDDEAKQRVWNSYVSACLRLRHGNRSRWKVVMDDIDSRASRAAGVMAEDGVGGGADGSGGSSNPPCIMELFESEAQHSLTYEMTETDCMVSNIGPDFELYVTMSAAMDLNEVVTSCNRLLRSIRRDDQWLFLTTPQFWT